MPENLKKQEFEQNVLVKLNQELSTWYKEQVELEQAMTNPTNDSDSKSNLSTNVWNASARIKSLQVVDLVMTIEAKMNFNIPDDRVPELVEQGGYANFEEMANDLIPKFEKIYIDGGLTEKKKEETTI